jgi:hypothetical protein
MTDKSPDEQGLAPQNSDAAASRRRLANIPILRALSREGDWKRADTLTAIGLAISIAAAAVGLSQFLISNPPTSPDLVLDKAEVTRTADIDATATGPDDSPENTKVQGSVIDITFRNKGSAPALLVGADLSFRQAAALKNCSGAGPGVVTARYDLRVPVDSTVTSNPFKVHRDMRFTVNPNSVDRIQLSIGPESYGSSEWPWVYQFSLSLTQDNGQTLAIGNISLLGLPGQTWNKLQDFSAASITPNDLACIASDAALLSSAMLSNGLHSPELQELYDEAEKIVTNASSCELIGASGNSCYTTIGRYFSDQRGVVTCTDSVEVVQSYNCDVAKAVAANYGHSSLSTTSFTVRWGLLVLPMACAASGSAEVCRSTDNQDLVVGFIP